MFNIKNKAMKKNEVFLINPANPNNPYDYMGQNHNYLMSTMMNNYEVEIDRIADLYERQSFIKEKTNELTQFYYQYMSDLNALDTVYSNDGLYSKINFDNYQAIIDHFDMPSYDKVILIEYYDKLTKIELIDSMQVNRAISLALNLEMNVLNSINRNNYLVLGAMAITRYSLYWAQTNLNFEDQIKGKVKWWHVLADTIGGLAGGLLGGGVGILPGAVAGTTIYEKCTE